MNNNYIALIEHNINISYITVTQSASAPSDPTRAVRTWISFLERLLTNVVTTGQNISNTILHIYTL